MMQVKSYKLISLGLILCLVFIFAIGAKTCNKPGGDKIKSGSSEYNTFMINAPLNLTATAIFPYQINLSWQDNSNNEDGFEIESRQGGTGSYTQIATVTVNTTSYSDTVSPSLLVYYYRIRAYNTIGDESEWSNTVNVVIVQSEWQSLAAGESHSLALNKNGSLWVWGNNYSGQLGMGYEPAAATIPTLLGSDTDWSRITNGYNHTLAIKRDSTLWAWGANESGQLGLGDTESDRYTPTQVGTDSDWSMVVGGANHTIALKTNLTMWAWGFNRAFSNGLFTYGGQLGLGDTIDRDTPTQIGNNSDWVTIGVGGMHSLAIKSNGTLWAWGYNTYGQLGDGTLTARNTPRLVDTASDWSLVSAGYVHTIALKTNGTIYQWGNAEYGFGETTPARIGTDTDWLTISAGGTVDEASNVLYHNLALKTNGSLWAWGMNPYGQLGLGDNLARSTPTQLGTYSNWVVVATGGYHNIGITSDDNICVWGRNDYYQLGLDDSFDRNNPCPLGSPTLPSSLKITATALSQFDLSWTDNANNELGLKIERKTGENGIWTQVYLTGPNVTNYLDTGLNSAYTYYYRIMAYNIFGNSSYAEVSANFTNVVPSSLNATVISSSQINLVWSDNSSNETGFKIERRYDGSGAYIQIDTAGPDITLYLDTTVTPGNTYYYQVRAYNNLGDSPSSNETEGISFVVAPSALTATASSSSQVDLVWTDINGKADYKIERKIEADGSYQQIATVSDIHLYSDTPLTQSTTYYYQVRAYNASGDSDYSPVANATTPEGSPGAPTSLIAYVISPTRIDIVWTDVSSETGYKIERKFGAGGTYDQIATTATNVITYNDTTVTPSNTYYYRVRAYNSSGDGSYSDETYTGTTPLCPLSEDPLPTVSDVNTMTAGYRFSSDVNGKIVALGRYADGSGGNTTVILWDDTGTELGRVTVSSDTGWQWANLSTPITVTAGTFYRVSVSCPTTFWIGDFPDSLTRGNITISDMCFMDGALNVFPNLCDNGMGMWGWADIAFVAE